jgi:AcrR family transcriptional regulator
VIDKNANKKEQIIKTAMQLFAVKGSSSTSMQEIAALCGISKGSLYLVFKSKEELERSIYIYCFRMIRDPLQREELENRRSPREKLRNQVEILLNHVYELREFLQRQIQEFAGKGVMEVPEWLRKSNAPLLTWFRNKLETLYGPDILAYTGDLSLLGSGMVHSYIRVIFNQGSPVSIARMADHLVDLLDIVVAGLLAGKPDPLISSAFLTQWLEEHGDNPRKSPLQLIKEMKVLLSATSAAGMQNLEEGLESLGILESEILMPHPRRAIVRGMLANLQSYPALDKELQDLNKLIAPHMQNTCGLY